jgi:hypothetical protein
MEISGQAESLISQSCSNLLALGMEELDNDQR